MKAQIFEKESELDAPASVVFDWHMKEEAFERLIPPWEPVEVVSRSGGIKEEGSRVTLSIGILGPLRVKWVAEHRNFEKGRRFQDVQVKGPFARWIHTHEMVPLDSDRCLLRDHIEYALPGGRVGEWLGGWFVRRKLSRMFDYRHRVTREAVEESLERDTRGGETAEPGGTDSP